MTEEPTEYQSEIQPQHASQIFQSIRAELRKVFIGQDDVAGQVLAALLAGRRWQGWRGRRATRWLYVGAVLLLLAYVGSRFVFEVLLARGSN